MKNDSRGKWNRLSKISLNRKNVRKRVLKLEAATLRHAHKFIIRRWANVRDVQRHVIAWVLGMGVLIAATGMQVMWYQQSYRTVAPAKTGTYAEAVLGPLDTMNPLFAVSSAEKSVSHLLFSSLLKYDSTGHLNNDLSAGVSLDSTKKVYTVRLKPNVKWSDGQDLTSDDVVFTINLIKDPNTRSSIKGWDDVGVKALDSTTVEFTLKNTYAPFLHVLTFPIVPKHILKDISPINIRENPFSKTPVGSGPFTYRFSQGSEQEGDRQVVYFAANDLYYQGSPSLERFQLHVYSNSTDIQKALSLNEVNAAADLSPFDVLAIDRSRYDVISEPINSGMFAIFNTKSNILKDTNVRKALQIGTDKRPILNKMPEGTLNLDLPFASGQLSGDLPSVQAFDIGNATKVFDDAGWRLNSNNVREKDGVELKLSVIAIKGSEYEKILEELATQWRALGIVIETKVIDLADLSQNATQTILQPRLYDVLIYELNNGGDPDVFAYWHSTQAIQTGFNFANYSNVLADDTLVSARSRLESNLRNAKYITFAKQWVNDVPAIGLYQSITQYVRSKNVKSFEESFTIVSSIDRYCNILDWSVGKRSVFTTP